MERAAGSKSRKVFSALVPVGLTRTATRLAAGTSSRKGSRRFATSSELKKLMPVRLPPGCERLATRPNLTGSVVAHGENTRNCRGCRLHRQGSGTSDRGDHGHPSAHQFGRQRGQSIKLVFGPEV